ncbi:MAG: efflux RND transporter periplasmic adaptor subunit [Planctomycetes bacterium]|nr:efflux RND transporter periplasmic adaptor subunit [Planctomycetota bacterium]
MKKAIKALVGILIIALAGFGLAKYYEYMQPGEEQTQEVTKQSKEPPLVRVTRIKTGTLEQRAFVTGTIHPDAQVRVMPEVAGVLEKFRLADGTLIEEGLEVKSGDLIGVVEHEDLKAALEEVKANVEQAMAGLDQTRASLDVARSTVRETEIGLAEAEREKKRMVALYEEGTATQQQRDKALTAYYTAQARLKVAHDNVEQAKAAVKSAKAAVKRAKATLTRARVRYEDATIEAPMSGVISEKYVDEGSNVNPSTPLLKIIKIDYVEVRGAVAGKYFSLVQPGKTPALVCASAYPEKEFPGKVDRVQPELDPRTRTAKVTVRVRNSGKELKPGMFARMELIVKQKRNVPVVPDVALVQSDDDLKAFVVNDMTVHIRDVRTGMKQSNLNEVLGGLTPGDMVVIRGHHLLEDGMKVRIEENEE